MKHLRNGLFVLLVCLTACTSSSRNEPQLPSDQSKIGTAENVAVERVGDVPALRGPLRIQCVSTEECWLHDNMKLWRSTNGGRQWQLKYSSNSDMQNIKAIQFLTADLGWMLRFDGLYKTEDAALTWISKRSSLPNYPNSDFQIVRFWRDGLVGWAVGGLYRPMSQKELRGSPPGNLLSPDGKGILVGAIYHTSDGGNTWEQQSLPEKPGRFLDVLPLDSKRAIAMGDAGAYRTDKGAESWLPLKFNEKCSQAKSNTAVPLDVSFVDLKLGWLTYGDGYVAKTSDGGRTWCDLTFAEDVWPAGHEPAYFEKIQFIDPTHGWALGGDHFLYESKDGGKKWVKTDTRMRFDDMYFSDTSHGWVVSQEGLFRLIT